MSIPFARKRLYAASYPCATRLAEYATKVPKKSKRMPVITPRPFHSLRHSGYPTHMGYSSMKCHVLQCPRSPEVPMGTAVQSITYPHFHRQQETKALLEELGG